MDEAGKPPDGLQKYNARNPDRRLKQLKRKFAALQEDSEKTVPLDKSNVQLSADEIQREKLRDEYARLLAEECARSEEGKQTTLSYDKFQKYAEAKERELWSIFQGLDTNNDNQLNRDEIRQALEERKIQMSPQALHDFFQALDADQDGHISFDDFREFLLLMSRPASFKEIVSFYRASKPIRRPSHQVTQDGDVTVGEKPPRQSKASSESAKIVSKPKQDSSTTASQSSSSEDDSEGDAHKSSFDGAGKYLLAGGIAGAISRSATAPFDRLKVYLITSSSASSVNIAEDVKSLNPARIAKAGSKGFVAFGNAAKAIYSEHNGLKGFFVGNGLNVLKIFPESALKFLTYETSKRFFARYIDKVDDTSQISNTSRFISGGLGGMTSQFSIYPIETVKTRLQSSQGGELSGTRLIKDLTGKMYRQGGIRPFYNGLTMGMVGVFPYAATDAALYELQKNYYCAYTGNDEPGVLPSLLFGALSGGIGATAVYPVNTIRTRLQAQGTSAHAAQYNGFRDVINQTMQKEGFRGFYRGLAPTLLKVAPSMAISWACYDLATAFLFEKKEKE